MVTSGEALPYALAERLYERLPDVKLENLYGPTEASVDVTRWSCPTEGDPRRIVPIGRPIANTRTYVLSPRLEPLPVGVAGELHLAGVQLARGYLNRPELSAERFVPDPFAAKPGERIYKTGDLCRWLADGSLEYLGRLDHQVKIRGNRIELGEIESALRRRQEVREAVVTAQGDGAGSKRLVAYIVLHEGAELAVDRWQRELKSVLPEYMVPQVFMALDALPLSANGKVDRRRLPEPESARPRLETEYVAPRNEVEELLAGIWQDVLGLERVGVLDNFFAVGGDSIKSIQVLARANQAGLRFTLAELFSAQTVSELAMVARRGEAELVHRTEPWALVSAEDRALLGEEIEDAYPLADLQAGMLFHSAYSPETAVYHDVFASRIRTGLDEDLLRESVRRLMARHAVLRTSFALSGYREPLELVHREVPAPVEVVDLRHLSAAEQDARLGEWLEAEKGRAFDWTQAPLFRLVVHRLSGEEFELALSFHHAILDGWSVATMLAELFGIYDALARGEEVRLADAGLSYRDFVALEREAIASEEAKRHWEDLLAGHTATRLPRLPGAKRTSGELGTAAREVPRELVGRLKALAQAWGVPLKSLLLAAHLRVLSLVSSQREVLTGLVSNSRPEEADGERVLGLFLNTLPLRVTLEDESWRALVQKVFAAERAGLPYRRYPAGRLKRAEREELFETAFNYNHFHVYQGLEGRVEVSQPRMFEYTNFTLMANFDLAPGGEGLAIRLNYDSGQLAAGEIERWAGYYLKCLEAIAADADGPVAATELLAESERTEVLEAFNATETPYDLSGTLDELFEAQVDRTPEATALVYEDRTLSYRDLDEQANRLAHLLRLRGVGADSVVGVMGYRSIELVEALYGVMKSGGAYLPLDPEYPAERVAAILADSRVEVMLVGPGLEERLGEWHGERIVLEESSWADQPSERPKRITGPENLAYVIYTSGSTGLPKGVAVEHAGIRNRLLWMQEAYGLTASDRVLQKTPYSFDVSVWEFFWPLISGATLVVARPGGHQDSGYLVELIRQQQISVLHFVPSMLRVFLEEQNVPTCTSLRLVVTSGEALPYALAERLYERLPDVKLENLYGPTEASVDVTRWSCPPVGDPRRIVPIGHPIANTRCYVLSGELEVLPVGVAGELYLAGVQLARGYLNRAELSAERFVPDPFAGRAGERMYKTGDLCRWLADGSLEYLGRLDYQVKIRGNRIELGEIESALRRRGEVREAVVTAREDGAGSKRLVAYVVPHEGADLVVDRWQRELKSVLPEYMVPQVLMALEALPLSANGKVDRRRLPEPESARPQLETEYVAPRNGVEELLAGIWQDVLGLERVGVLDNFFAVGGDSIKSIQVLARANEAGLRFTLAGLFSAQTVSELALVARQGEAELVQRTEPWALVSAEDRALLGEEIEDAYPLADLQAGMLFHSAYSPETAVYHDVFASRIRAELNEDVLRESVVRLMARHAVLRTSFALSGYREPLELVHREVPAPVEVVDLRQFSASEQDARLAEWLEAEKGRAFDWTQAPLFRLVVHRLSGEEFELALSFHHAILDGWSVATMLAELFGIYDGLARGEAVRLPDAGLTYRDFVALEREAIASAEAKRYWEELLAGHTATRLPRLPGAKRTSGILGTAAREVPVELVGRLKGLAQAWGVPLKSLLLAAHLRVLSLVSSQREVLTGLVSNSRPEEAEGERVLGLFLNTLPLRVTLEDESWQALVQRVFAAERAGLPYRRYPAGRLKRAEREELFETAFNYNHFHVYQGLEARVEVSQPRMFEYTNFTFVASFQQSPDSTRLDITFNYDSGQFDVDQVSAIADHYLRALEAMADRPEDCHDPCVLLADSERQQMLLDWNHTHRDLPVEHQVQDVFSAHAVQRPDAVAVAAGDIKWSYGELEERSNCLAHYLVGRGVGPDVPVAVLIDRSAEMIAAILGVLKAGGAYLPLDPAYPQDRLKYMVEDSGAGVVLSTHDVGLRYPGLADRFVLLDADWPAIATQPASAPQRRTTNGNLAYVIYTSGSTGRPKGVAVEHGSLSNLVAWHLQQYGWTVNDRATQIAAPGFDASVWEIWPCLTSGGILYIPADELRQSPSQLVPWLADHGITVAFLPTPLAETVLDLPWPADSPLRLLTTGGDQLNRRPSANHPFRLINVYGPTENTVASTVSVVNPADQDDSRPTIGRPIANTRAYILDRSMNPVPIGTPGELYLGGTGLARGYLGRAKLTAERFVPNPFATRPGERLYKTGDLARWLRDGEIEFLGRVDYQLKVRGYRIELGEIEAVLAEHDAVRQAAVAAWPDRFGQNRLVAYFVPREGRTIATDALREHLQKRLPEYMVPSALVALEHLPLTPNGKVDRRRLPEPQSSQIEREYVVPRTPSEQLLAGIWQEVLGVDRVGATDNFFELGGHSLSAMRMMADVEAATGVQIPLRDLFQNGTVERLAESIGGRQTGAVQLPLVEIQAGDGDRPIFFVHPAEGVVMAYAAIAQRLKSSQPFYGLQAPGLEDEAEPVDRVEAMASRYVEAIRTVQPRGKYLLAGWSYGGLVAFEMAQQLKAAGDEVAWLGLFDSFILSRGTADPLFDDRRMFASGAKQYLEQMGLELPVPEDELARHEPSEQVEIILSSLAESGNELSEAMTRQARNLLRIWDINAAAGRRYLPQPYDGDVAFFRAADDESAAGDAQPDPLRQWQELLARPLAAHRVPGTHTSMMLDPQNVDVLAEQLQGILDNLKAIHPTD